MVVRARAEEPGEQVVVDGGRVGREFVRVLAVDGVRVGAASGAVHGLEEGQDLRRREIGGGYRLDAVELRLVERRHEAVVRGRHERVLAAADKAKLDGIEAGATADQTAGEILALLKTVDGAGSGLDADLLDGVQHRGTGGTSEHPAAATSQAGFMSASDKAKLDGLAAKREYSFQTGTVSNGGFIPGPTPGFTEIAIFTSL
ncbi:MAG: hypothetical protein Fur0037_19090 [Planctomycetota bacterium]